MSVLTTLALMVTSFVAKPRPHDVEITELKALVDELNRQLMEAGHQRDEARLEGDRWRAMVERYQGREEQQRPAGPNFGAQLEMDRARAQTQQLMAMAQSQQYQYQDNMAQNQQQALAAQNYGQGFPQMLDGLAGAHQGLCNCVPARHDMFLPSGQRL